MVIWCIGPGVRKTIRTKVLDELRKLRLMTEKFDVTRDVHRKIEDLEAFEEQIDDIPSCKDATRPKGCPPCDIQEKSKKRKKSKRKKTARNIFIGDCMRKPENGGRGLEMKVCSDEWKSISSDKKAEYEKRAKEA